MTNQYDKIPNELKQLKQWIVWKYEDIGARKPTKVPYIPGTTRHADVTDPDTWVEFTVACFYSKNYDGIGFVFKKGGKYSGIDLDDCEGNQVNLDKQIRIFREFNSYSEKSPSGKGLHIIVEGIVPSGRRRSNIEIYSSERYFTFTGDTYPENELPKPIRECQSLLTQLWEQMGAGAPAIHLFKGDDQERLKDEEIIKQATEAVNGEKFNSLYRGEWQDLYPSQSEADYALIDIIAFYTQHRNQISRIFRSSVLGKRSKAERKDYLTWMINKSFDRMLPPLDFDGFKIALENKIKANGIDKEASIAQLVEPTVHNRLDIGSNPIASTNIPPGLMGEIAQFIYAAAPRPVPEIALAGAIGLMAGICGRAYNVSGTGLNQYVLMLAPTGCHAKGSKILMFDGTLKNVEDIHVNEYLMGPDSLPRKVLSLARGFQSMVKIIPTKGKPFVVNLDHVLSLVDTCTRVRTNITVREWLTKNKTFKHRNKLKREAVEFICPFNLPLDPWFLGAMLGDGQFGPRITLTSADECIRVKAANIVIKLGMKIRTTQVNGNKSFQDTYIKIINSMYKGERKSNLQLIIQELGLWQSNAANKFIPHIYKISNRQNRMAVLAGLLDTDGHAHMNGYDYISKSKQLAEDVTFIARSLGYAAYINESEKYSQNGTGGIYYRVSLSGDMSELPLVLEYKKSNIRKQKKDVLVTGFKIQLLNIDNYYGFQLDKDCLYLTDDFTVHHNSGKEAMALGIDRLMNNVRMMAPTSSSFIGPSEIASGQALIKHLSKSSQCFVSILGEFGLRLEAMSNPNANSAEKALKRMLLDLYNKSGFGQVFRPSIYADAEKNINATESPSFSILGESTPERFYAVLNEDMISEGLLPRFMLIEYNGLRPPLSETHLQANPIWLADKVATLVAYCQTLMNSSPRKINNINLNQQADKMFRNFDKFCDEQINGTNKEVLRQLWNRAHIKALKIAGLIAVGVNPYEPLIIPQFVEWAINMVQNDIKALSAKFEAGEIGKNTDETKQSNELTRMIKDYVTNSWNHAKIYCPSDKMEKMHYEKVIPYVYLNKRLSILACYQRDKIGATNAIKRAIQTLLDTESLKELNKSDCIKRFGIAQRSFIISNVNILNN